MVDTWLGFLLKSIENMGLMDKTAVIFTTDHGFYFGEHGGLFGKMNSDKFPDGTLRPYGEPGSKWTYSPPFEELIHLPLLIHAPGISPGVYKGLSSAVDVMPTVLDLIGDGDSGLRSRKVSYARDARCIPPRAGVRSQQHSLRQPPAIRSILWTTCSVLHSLSDHPVTTITSGEWSLLYSPPEGLSELYNLSSDPNQLKNVIGAHTDDAREIHQLLVKFMRETEVPDRILKPRLELRS